MEVKRGFKQTEVGAIPEDWRLRPMLSVVRVANGQVDPKIAPYRSMTLVAPDHIESSTGRLLKKETAADQRAISGKYIFEKGDVVYSKIRPYLKKAVLANFDGLCSADMYPLKPAPDVSGGFVLAAILGHHFSRYAESVSVRSGMPKINRAELAEYSMALPPTKAEQEAIAEALSDADALIESLEQLLAKKRHLRQAVMQKLLTGQVRLAGFRGKWVTRRLSEVAEANWGNTTITKSSYRESGFRAFSAAGPDGFVDHFEHNKPAVVLSAIGALCGRTWLARDKWTAIKNTIWIRGNEIEAVSAFLYWITNDMEFWPKRGQAQPFISLGDVRTAHVTLPPLPEQIAIAKILREIDEELAALEQRRGKALQLKQGMMQELLTGRIRLV